MSTSNKKVYYSKFDIDLKEGERYEQYVEDMLNGKTKIEVKSEISLWKDTGNIFIEFECSGKPSGLRKTESELYALNFVDSDSVQGTFIVPTYKLKHYIVKNLKSLRVVNGGDNKLAKGWLLKIEDMHKILFV